MLNKRWVEFCDLLLEIWWSFYPGHPDWQGIIDWNFNHPDAGFHPDTWVHRTLQNVGEREPQPQELG